MNFALACAEAYAAWKRGDVKGAVDEAGDVLNELEDAVEYLTDGADDFERCEGCDDEDCEGCCLIECECAEGESCWVCEEQE